MVFLPMLGALLSGCAMFRDSNDPAKDKQYVVVVNSLTWVNPVSGKKDGTRTAWPLVQLANNEEVFPLAQIKHCPENLPCAWGVLSAARNITRYAYAPGGVTLDIGLDVDVHRRQQDRRRNFHTSLAVPSDVPALSYQKSQLQTIALPYGKVYRVDLEYGISYAICAQRMSAEGRPVDKCDIPYI
ncbi:hypothetical protein [Pseudoduganella sp. RAF53_2]|uniref:hypothetical protein n=1 Tax=Pseudoduganella sp. RAF53_2 TaxID=3233060 RepID=UPI003F972BB3